jgi:membrane associated rhomboid family serine protease
MSVATRLVAARARAPYAPLVIPVADEPRPEGHVPWASYGLILVNILVYGLTRATVEEDAAYDTFRAWGVTPAEFDPITLVTSQFLHGGPGHLFGNMLFLWIFGENVEWCLGHVGFVVAYLATGILGGAVYAVAQPDSTIPGIGASGAISGILGIYLVAFPRNLVRVVTWFWGFWTFRLPAWLLLVGWFVWDDLIPAIREGWESSTGHWVHVASFLAGFLFAWILRRAVERRAAAVRSIPARPAYARARR